MQKEGLIEEIKTDYYKHEITKNLPLKESDLSLLSARELVFIDSKLEKHSGKIAAELSAFFMKIFQGLEQKKKRFLITKLSFIVLQKLR